MLNWKLLVFNWCFWSSALVVDSAALTASQLDATDVCRFVKASLEKTLPGKPDSLYISYSISAGLAEASKLGYVEHNWKLVSKFEPLARDFLDYCLKVPNISTMVDICTQYINNSFQHNNRINETNYSNRTSSIGLLTTLNLISGSSNAETFNPLSRVDSPLQLIRTSTSLSRVFLTIYLAGNPGTYRSLDRKLTASEPILCVENPLNNTYCTTMLLTTDNTFRSDGLTRVTVSMGKDPNSMENTLNTDIIALAIFDFVDYQTYYRDRCAILLPISSLNDWKFINCVSFYLQRFRNANLYRYNRLLIGQNVAYWHSRLLGDVCARITPNHGPIHRIKDTLVPVKCPSIRLRQSGLSWLMSLLCIGLILASFSTLLNFVLLCLLAFRRRQKDHRLRPYVLNIALIGTLWGLLDAFDYSMMLVGYEMFGDPNRKPLATTRHIYYHCCSDNLWAAVPTYGSTPTFSPAAFSSNSDLILGPDKLYFLIYSVLIFLTTYTLQACCVFTFVAMAVIQVYSLMWPFKRPACMDKPNNNLCFLWVIAVLISISVTGPLAAPNIRKVTVKSQGSQLKSEAEQEWYNTTVASTYNLIASAEGDSRLLQASSLCGVVMAVLLQSIDGVLAVTLTVLVCYIRRSSGRAVGVGKKHTAGPSNRNDGKISTATPRTVTVLGTVIMASGISWISAIPMLHYLLTIHRLADSATCDYDVYSQTVTFDLARTYLLGRLFLLLTPFANPILVAIRYRAVLFPPAICGPKNNIPMTSNERSTNMVST